MMETVTIINNSGKIISTGKHLLGIFKDAKAAYKEKKAALKPEPPAPEPGIRRAQTFDVPRHHHQDYYYEDEEEDDYYDDPRHRQHYHLEHRPPPEQLAWEEQRRFIQSGGGGRRYIDDGRSQAERRRSVDDTGRSVTSSHRSYRSHRSSSRVDDRGGVGGRRPALTAGNLKTLTEVSATAPSTAPRAYRSPYAETAPRDMMLSRPTLAHAATVPVDQMSRAPSQMTRGYVPEPPTEVTESTAVPTARQSMVVARPRSDPSLRKRKSIDMDLAYGSIPPDLESRTDLNPTHTAANKPLSPSDNEAEAISLMSRIEHLLVEAQCLQHGATAIIAKLQTNPDAAAAVALTLAELSAILTKMSPGFIGVIKGGAPAVFALLASPQFLIAAGAAVGVTVVMFGGWKIVKRMQEQKKLAAVAAEQQPPVEMAVLAEQQQFVEEPHPMDAHPHMMGEAQEYYYGAGGIPAAAARPYVQRSRGPPSAVFDEALVLDEELSSIETWRRGIADSVAEGGGPDDASSLVSADLELISPEALRSTLDDDAMSRRTGRTHRTHRTRRTHKTERSERTSGRARSHESSDRRKDRDSKRGGSSRHHRDDRLEREREKDRERRHRERDRESEAGSTTSSRRSHHSSSSSRRPKMIEDGRSNAAGDETSLDAVLGKNKGGEKKGNMLKSLFKKMKDKDERKEVSVMVK